MRESTSQLNAAIRLTAAETGVHFVSVEDHFEGHGACGTAGDDWVHGLVLFPPKTSFHPTLRGQAEYARVIDDYLRRNRFGWPFGYLPSGLPRNPPGVPARLRAAAVDPLPSFGSLEVALSSPVPGCGSGNDVIAPDASVDIAGDGFAASEAVAVKLVLSDGSEFDLREFTYYSTSR